MKYAIIYGGIAGAVAISVISATLATELVGHSILVGYLIMLAALSLIVVGVKRYRDVECGGVIGFGRAFGIGLAMAVVAGVVYALGWEIFIAVSGFDFMADYTNDLVAQMRAEGATQAAIDAQVAGMADMKAMYDNMLLRMLMIFAEIAPVGLVVALISAAVLRNPKVMPARG